jgi:DNA-binding MarR family transcriptional regulator
MPPRTILDPFIVDSLLPLLVGKDRQPSAFLVYLYLWHRGSASRRTAIAVSLQTMAEETGLSKSAVQRGVRTLLRRRLIRIEKSSATAVPGYTVLRPWLRR